jgi:hypothetical protein
MALINTHATVKKFIQHGFTEQQAEVIVETINNQNNELVTKQDLDVSSSNHKTQFPQSRKFLSRISDTIK